MKTVKEEVNFRASGNGALLTNKKGSGITATQLKAIATSELKIREGGKLTPTQLQTLKDNKIKRDKPFELSDTAKSFVQAIWLQNKKGFRKDIKSKYLDKGIFGEEVGMNLLSDVDGRFYTKNTERITRDNLTGECDSKFEIDPKLSLTPEIYKGRKVKIIQDVKCCWDSETFMNSKFDPLYENQGRTYLELYDCDEFWLRYCLVDCPEHLVQKEKNYLFNKYYSDSMDDQGIEELEKMLEPLFEQIERNLVYSNNPQYTKEERVKTFKITRDKEEFKKLQDRIPAALKYYDSIKLNQIV